jgi:hypothetical protein
MSYRPQVKSSRSGRGHQKTQRDKNKRKQKHPSGYGDTRDEIALPKEEAVEKTVNSLRGLGSQKFALSPFSQYFDDWLVNLREILSVFESNPSVSVDDMFINDRSRILAGIEGELNRKRSDETELEKKMKSRSEKNHLLAQLDADYAAETRGIQQKRNVEIENLTKPVSELEKELDETNKMKTSFFGAFSKKAKAQKQAEISGRLSAAKKKLEKTIQNFKVEQEKLHDEYEKKKEKTIRELEFLEKEIKNEEIDTSLEHRQTACESLIDTINEFLRRGTQTGHTQ